MSIVMLIYEICVIEESLTKFLMHTTELELSKSKSVNTTWTLTYTIMTTGKHPNLN